jgi:hypothetical protein
MEVYLHTFLTPTPLVRRLSRLQNRSRYGGEEKNPFSLPGIESLLSSS